jgi:hypothetical protein
MDRGLFMTRSIKAFDLGEGISKISAFLRKGGHVRGLQINHHRVYVEYENTDPKSCVTNVRYIVDGNTTSVPAAVNEILGREDVLNLHWAVSLNLEKASTWYVITWEE